MTAANKAYITWRETVAHRLNEIYCVTIEDVGFDEPYLIRHWKSKETPSHFVEWFGNKYDLDRRPMPIQTLGR
ncbi:MAG TPA: hypothetical protein VK804_18725 [Bradyrhizobium sp.]|jgi:hypothetical protein|uniref:hypothetical protein n=1 Tax=Bradyrhizobium sp. TaxID=376 RepID=UPI002C4D95B6|nr:hypothetical protein [Bradyrhizobium sp.]HTB02502.1 hypothetical protein [Bradyrhizobium sp.]